MKTREEDAVDDVQYPQVVRAFAETPWAIIPERLAVIRDVVAARARGERLTDDEIDARIGAGPPRRQNATQGTVAILPIYGVIVPRATLFTKMSGGTSITEFAQMFREAVANPQIDAILLDIDSPGGSTDLVAELAAEIRAARGTKPIVAIANTMAASAAYWIGSQADEFVVTPSGQVGSIGVFAAHEDISEQLAQEGVKVTLIKAGKYKAETNPFEPLTDDARAALQSRIDEMYGMFVTAVAKGRGVSVDAVRNGFGQGRIVTPKNALAEGMVDRVDTYEATVSRLIRGSIARKDASALAAEDEPPGDEPADVVPEAAVSGLSFADEAAAARDACDRLVNRTRSLAEVRRGRLTGAKRDQIAAVATSLSEANEALVGLLAETNPNQHVEAGLRERARFEQLRANHL